MFDTHCHLNFKRFKSSRDEVIQRAFEAGISGILVPGTDVDSSKKAVELTRTHAGIYAAVGIHPHHLFELLSSNEAGRVPELLGTIHGLLQDQKVLAVGEVGIDRHVYAGTKYESYAVSDAFVKLQKQVLAEEIKLALHEHKSIIFHNREAKADLLEVLSPWANSLAGRAVFHCCEPDSDLLSYAQKHHIYMGVDGDITYDTAKQEFVKHVPLDLLVLETDAPYLLPEPLRSQKKYPNEPAYITYTAAAIARLTGVSVEEIRKRTTENAYRLFGITRT